MTWLIYLAIWILAQPLIVILWHGFAGINRLNYGG